MRIRTLFPKLGGIFLPLIISAQSNLSRDAYYQFLQSNQDLDYPDLQKCFTPAYSYYKGFQGTPALEDYLYLDSIIIKKNLTTDELDLLRQNQFMVTERLTYQNIPNAFYVNFMHAFLDIYHSDLPVFISTDAILHTVHKSYDNILMDVEIAYLKPILRQLLQKLYDGIPNLIQKYQTYPQLLTSLEDVDLYITIAYSLLDDIRLAPHIVPQKVLDKVWNAILNQGYCVMPLFCNAARELDFSQFIARGHYDCDELRDYFKAMMWLGRIDFLLTPPPGLLLSDDDIRRMNVDAYLLNELINTTQSREILEKIDLVIRLFVGESDNLTPQEFDEITTIQQLTSATQLLDTSRFNDYYEFLNSYPNAGQKILSDIFTMNPFTNESDLLPISYRLLGQRFIVDAYIFSNVVFDRIIYQGRKIWRPLPDPLDAMFVLGNDNALPLLKGAIDTFHYASQLKALRYLVDSYDNSFWQMSLYNVWLDAIRSLNPPVKRTGLPYFMLSAAWQHQKLNTQLASWAQLRHDNLLYAKQSYTGGWICSFPHSYVEPNPEFFSRLANYATRAQEQFRQLGISTYHIDTYLNSLKSIMTKLEIIARKELSHEQFSPEEITFLQGMLYPPDGMCGATPTGWFTNLFYYDSDVETIDDPVVADVHTQPTDEGGSVVGNVLHVGTGNINLGVFLAPSPSYAFKPMAYIGPVFSYYEKVTSNFDRLTDERWRELVRKTLLPERPDWVNIYLADKNGNKRVPGREIPSVTYQSGITPAEPSEQIPSKFALYQNYPNPFNLSTIIKYDLPQKSRVSLAIYNAYGQTVDILINTIQEAGTYHVRWNANNLGSGVYFYILKTEKFHKVGKAILIK
jgi:hypothetical protein